MLTTRPTITAFDLPGDAAAAESAILATLAGARHRIRLCMYSLTRRSIVDALIAAHVRGVDVQCVLDRSQATDLYDSAETARLVAGIGAENVTIGTTPNGAIIHVKLLSCDGKHWIGGSCNFSNAAMSETNSVLVASSAALCADLEARFDALKLWNDAHPYVPKPPPALAPSSGELPGA